MDQKPEDKTSTSTADVVIRSKNDYSLNRYSLNLYYQARLAGVEECWHETLRREEMRIAAEEQRAADARAREV